LPDRPFRVAEGIATASPLFLETPETLVLGRGNVSFADETMLLDIRPYAKDGSTRSVGMPLRVEGTFADPKISVDKAGFAARIGAALGLTPIEVPSDLKRLLAGGLGESGACGRALIETIGGSTTERRSPCRRTPASRCGMNRLAELAPRSRVKSFRSAGCGFRRRFAVADRLLTRRTTPELL
jgi:hypothetical protein